MHLNTSVESAVMELYLAYWESYITGDVDKLASCLDDNYTQVGSAESEVFFNKKEAVQFVRSTIHQVAGKVDMRNRNISLGHLDGLILISEQTDLYFEQDGNWAFYAKFRASSLLQQKDGVWRIIHQHSSMPDLRAQDGENIAIEKVTKENFDLRDAIKRRTVELEYKNRELEMEASLERVRTVAMGMRNGADLMDICEVLFNELEKLGFDGLRNAMINIYDDANEVFLNYDYAPGPGKTVTPFAYNIHPIIQRQVSQLRSSRDAFSEIVITGNELAEFRAMRVSNGEADDPRFDTIPAVNYYFYSTGTGAIGLSSFSTITEDNRKVLIRFRNVFDLAYRRYMDISQAVAQAKEGQIEVALERVRSRSMGMQKSEELKDVIKIIYQQLANLNINCDHAGFVVDYTPGGDWNFWIADEQDIPAKITHPYFDSVWANQFNEAKATGKNLFATYLNFEEKNKFYQELLSYIPGLPELTKDFYLSCPGLAASTVLYDTVGLYIENFSAVPYTDEENSILLRLGKVFQQTYTRFLDLKKAEAQAKESQVEAALEKVRSRTMAMQKSDELLDVASILFQQVKALGVTQWNCGFNIWEIGDEEFIYYPGTPDGIISPSPCKIPLTEHPVFKSFDESRRRGDELFIYEKEGDFQRGHYQYMLTLPGVGDLLQSMVNAGFEFPVFQIDHVANFAYGNLIFITYQHFPEMHDVFKRFAKVFEQTYTRFLDLQKAEAQAKESQIEAALERVRSRSMGMQKSDELRDVIQVIYEQMVGLNINIDSAGFDLDFRENDDWNLWHADAYTPFPNKIHVPYFDHPFTNAIIEAKKNGVEFLTFNHTIDNRNKIFDQVFKYAPASPDAKEALYATPGLAESHVYLKNVWLYISNYAGIPYTAAENATLIRFGKVFEQAYTRFNDLKQAETQALEAIKRASVDRVRAEIASMRTTADLDRITPLIWNELTTLGVPFIRCGVFIMYEEQQQVHTYLSNPEGEAIAAFHQPYNTPGEISEVVTSWRKKEMYVQHWDEARFNEFTNNLVQKGAITSGEKYLTENRPTDLYLHFLPFLQGMLYVGNSEALSENELQLVQNLADAFSTAYSRYEDFNKLEAAKQQVDKTLADLKQTQSQLVQAEKMASLGELTAGIAHEIQNPLNFVNNFSELNAELIGEMEQEIGLGNLDAIKLIANDIRENEQKINHHGKRADSIVKGMLQHSRNSVGEKTPTDINALADEYLRLAYHGFRSKDKDCNISLRVEFDNALPKIAVIPQDIGRVLLNLYNNSFYAVAERGRQDGANFEPTVMVSTSMNGENLVIMVKDNGYGIPGKVLDKIFQPFFTTKPTGQGTGLGLSLSYDMIKAHGGELNVESKEGEGVAFIIQLPAIG